MCIGLIYYSMMFSLKTKQNNNKEKEKPKSKQTKNPQHLEQKCFIFIIFGLSLVSLKGM